MKLLILLGVALATVCVGMAVSKTASADDEPRPGKQVPRKLARGDGTVHYLLFLPADYGQGERKWPLMLFLHGAGERGDGNLELVKTHGPPKIVDSKPDFPFIVVSPQCPTGERWEAETLTALLDHVQKTYAVDADRVYVTGLSMGGYGTWTLAASAPQRFAAAVAICGGGNPDDAAKLKDLPIRVYHGDRDEAVPVQRSREMVEALKKAGGRVEFTIYEGVGHDSWTRTYDDPALYDWLLAQRRHK